MITIPIKFVRRISLCLLLYIVVFSPLQSFGQRNGITKSFANFEIGNKTFLLNGKPFIIKAAELHYTRIPRHYWEHRIKMCKALGMNTICLYAFWNIHEQEPGKFDFSGQNDIAAFCKLAQKHGMYIILRPGPYVCAEWEMGGLPWWLLKKKDVKLRSQDPYFLARTGLFINQIGRQLANLQIRRGGNIILVQVENEYGAFNTNKAYIADIRDLVKKAGFTDVPLFQCDWSSNFKNNALDGLLWTVNFGTGANIKAQFAELEKMAPTQPLMCSEFWSGWFDNWGRKHEIRDASTMIKGIEEMLDNRISFSLYMTHGGTTFGHWGGANSPAYSPMCTSYDYDAPISEAGWITPKFTQLRELLMKYPDEGKKMPDVPAEIPTIQIPEFELREQAPLFANLPKPIISEDIKSMESFNQGWGTILYRSILPQIKKEASLTVSEVHDWAQVFLDGKLIGTLDRRKGEHTLKLPLTEKDAQLDILVEAMGRVNFGEAIYDYKGITEKVELVTTSGRTNLKKWRVYSFPPEYQFVKDKRYTKDKAGLKNVPAYYKGAFQLSEVGDVFIDMQQWGKGMVWINGHSIGRFWEIGPQQTLYMPGCWLKKGKNEIIILDLKGPKFAKVSGLEKPILDQLQLVNTALHRKEGSVLDVRAIAPFYQGSAEPGNGWKKIVFPNQVKGRYLCFEIESNEKEKEASAIAEFNLIGDDGKDISREKWKIDYADSEEVTQGNNGADKIFDLQESTFWMTRKSDRMPHQLVIDLGEVRSIAGVRLLPRMEEGTPGWIKNFKVYFSEVPFTVKEK